MFAFASGASLAAAALVLRLRYDAPPRPSAPRGRLLADAAEGIRAVVGNRDLALFLGLALAQTFTRGALTVFPVVVALDLLRTGEPGVGTLTAAIGAGAVIGSIGASLLVGSAAARSVVRHRRCVVGIANRPDSALSSAGNRLDPAGLRRQSATRSSMSACSR